MPLEPVPGQGPCEEDIVGLFYADVDGLFEFLLLHFHDGELFLEEGRDWVYNDFDIARLVVT